MKSFENTLETPKVCLSCSIWLENHCFPTGNKIKFENFFEKFFLKKTLKMSHSAEKWKGGTLWDSLTYILLQNIKKLEGGLFWDLKKFRKKIRTVPKKNWKGDPLVSSGFVGYVKKVKKWKGGPFCTNFRWPDLASYASSFDCKKSGPIRVRL